MSILVTTGYRLYIWIGSVRYYANRSDTSPLPRVRWSPFDKEYPDRFDYVDAQSIQTFYIDQKVKVEEVRLVDEV